MKKQRTWLGSELEKGGRYLPDPMNNEPMYGQAFQIVSVQFESIDREFTKWVDNEVWVGRASVNFKKYADELMLTGKDWKEWKKVKKKISDDFCRDINYMINRFFKDITPVKDVVALKIKYLGGETQVL